jgi:hypothetical protein
MQQALYQAETARRVDTCGDIKMFLEDNAAVLNPKYHLADKIKKNEVSGNMEQTEEKIKAGWGDGIKMDLEKTGWGHVEWIHLAQDRELRRALVNTVKNLPVLVPQS